MTQTEAYLESVLTCKVDDLVQIWIKCTSGENIFDLEHTFADMA